MWKNWKKGETTLSLETIKTVEDLSLNAWPSHQLQVYDGWILRFSYFYTHRTNSVEVIGPSELSLKEKVDYCEEVYKKWGSPAVFKISPLTPNALELLLQERGYEEQHKVDNMVVDLEKVAPLERTPALPLVLGDRVDEEWIQGLFALKGTDNPVHKQIVPSMYAAIPKDEITVKILDENGAVAATGLGILDRGYVGVYAIHVREDHRRKGLAEAIVRTILQKGKEQGAEKAYLQVVSDNTAAFKLYEKIGFRPEYSCWFLVQTNGVS